MSHDATQYQRRLASMLPPGIDWLRVDPRVERLLKGLGAVGARVDATVEAFARDLLATQSEGETLAAWESALGLPDADRPEVDPTDVAARQAAVSKALCLLVTSNPDQNATATLALFVTLADEWGIAVRADEPSSNPSEVWIYGPPEHVKVFRCGSHCGDHIKEASATWEHVEVLICRYVPAHVRVHFVDELES
jgi:uncharacterized protein YmfQ (DUF2313 family)